MLKRSSKPKKVPRRIKFSCPFPTCTYTCWRYGLLDVHKQRTHFCSRCGNSFFDVSQHICTVQQQQGGSYNTNFNFISTDFKQHAIALNGVLLEYMHEPKKNETLVASVFENVFSELERFLEGALEHYKSLRVSFTIIASMIEQSTLTRKPNTPIGCPWSILLHKNYITDVIYNCASYIIMSLNFMNERGSQWCLELIKSLIVRIGEYRPSLVAGGCGMQTPAELKGKKGLLNIRAAGPFCFHYCIIAFFHRQSVVEDRIKARAEKGIIPKNEKELAKWQYTGQHNYKYYKKYFLQTELNFNDIKVDNVNGVDFESISIFEEANDCCISIYTNYGSNIDIIRQPKCIRKYFIPLLLVSNKKQSHFILIFDLQSLLGKSGVHKHYVCMLCNNSRFLSESSLEEHKLRCGALNRILPSPPRQKTFRFKKFSMTLRQPYILYYKIECVKVKNDLGHLHVPFAYSLCLISATELLLLEYYNGESVISHFLKRALEISKLVIEKNHDTNNWIKPTEQQLIIHLSKTVCDFCKRPFTLEDPATYHHDHYSGVYCATVHNSENLPAKLPKGLCAVSYDISKHDKHLLIDGFHQNIIKKVSPVVTSSGSFLGMMINKILKITSLSHFRDGELSELIKEINQSKLEFVHARKYFSLVPEAIDILLNGDFSLPCYNNIETAKKELNCNGFAPLKYFQDMSLPKQKGSEMLFNALKCVTQGDFYEFVLKAKVLLLSGVFESFRNTALKEHGLDPACVYSASRLSFDAAFFSSAEEVEYLRNTEMMDMVDKGIVGGLSQVNGRILESNTNRFGIFDKTKASCEILFIDLVSSYSYALYSNGYAVGGFSFLSTEEINNFNFLNPPEDGYGYIFELDFDYPDEIKDTTASFPLSFERRTVLNENLSEWQKRYSAEHPSSFISSERLLLTQYNKTNKVHYHKLISFFVLNGLVISKIHKSFRFLEKKIFADYVHGNSMKRKVAPSKDLEAFYKFMNNVLSGRLLISNLKYKDLRYCFTEKQARTEMVSDRFGDVEILGENLSIFKRNKVKGIDANMRIMGMVILELGKLQLYKGYYEILKPTFPDIELKFMNTDSLCCTIQNVTGQDFLMKLNSLKQHFDFSNLQKNHSLYSTENKMVPGKWKLVHDQIKEALFIKPNQYSLAFIDNDGINTSYCLKASGVPTDILKLQFRHEFYRTIIENPSEFAKIQTESVRLINNNVITIKQSKLSFFGLDTSRYFIDNYQSLPFGHFLIPNGKTCTD